MNIQSSMIRKFFLVFVTIILVEGRAISQSADLPAVGAPAPTFSLRDMDRRLISLSDLVYPGEPRRGYPKAAAVMIDFFRTDCAPCRKSIGHLQTIYTGYKERGVQVYIIALLEEESGRERLDQFLSQTKLSVPVLVDTYSVVAKNYIRQGESFQLPSTFIIDRQGILRGRFGFIGEKNLAEVNRLIEKVLSTP